MRWLDRAGVCAGCFRGWSATKQDIAIITIVYFLSQGAILFLTGKWVDDWCPFWEDETLREMAYMAGEGEPAIWIKRLGYALPGNGYLFLTFFFFYMASLSLYWILVTVNDIPRWDRIWLVLFFTVLPVNDARVTNICFPYAFGYGVFFIAFFLLTQFFSIKNNILRWLVRVCILALFAAGFVTNSLLVFYAIPIAYIWYREDKRGISLLWRYADFLVLPIVIWVIKKSLWPAYGFYAGYNEVRLSGLLRACVQIFPASVSVIWRILVEIAHPMLFIGICIWSLYKLYQCFIFTMPTTEEQKSRLRYALILGFVFLGIGIFPYLVVGKSFSNISGFNGRDSVLVPLGTAFIFYYGIKLCPIEEKLRHIVCVMLVLMSIGRMNQRYIGYQEWAYQQMAIGEHMRHSSEIKEGQNFLWVHLGASDAVQRCDYWAMNGIAREIFGDEKRLFLTEDELHSNWYQDITVKMLTNHQYSLRQYDLKNQKLDGVILYQYSSISRRTLLSLKFDEMFRPHRFWNRIASLGYMDYIPAGGFIINDKDMPTMWSEKGAADILQRIPKPFVAPK